jgi:hypothetical protein
MENFKTLGESWFVADVEEDIDCVACDKGFAPASLSCRSENVFLDRRTELQRSGYIEAHNSILLPISKNSMEDSHSMTLTAQQINIPLRVA